MYMYMYIYMYINTVMHIDIRSQQTADSDHFNVSMLVTRIENQIK